MLFTSPEFLLAFLPRDARGLPSLARSAEAGLCVPWLFLASTVFYAWWSPRFLILLIVSMLVNWWDAHAMARQHGVRRKALFIFGLVWNLGILAYFKYADFFISSLDAGLGRRIGRSSTSSCRSASPSSPSRRSPIWSISMRVREAWPLRDYALFVFFFPQLIAGPIVHHTEVMPQFRDGGKAPDRISGSNTAIGLTLS